MRSSLVIPNYVRYKASTNTEHWLLQRGQWSGRWFYNAVSNLSENAKLIHGVNDAGKRLQ